MGVGRIFSRGGKRGFFWRGAKCGEISLFPLETKKTTFFADNFMEKCQISKSTGALEPPASPSNDHACDYIF